MRFTIGSMMIVMGAATFLGPIVAPSLFDPFSRSMVTFFAISWTLLGVLFWRAMPALQGFVADTASENVPRREGRRSPARPPV